MKRRQSLPRQWLVADSRLGEEVWTAVRNLPKGSGILFLYRGVPKAKRVWLLAKLRRLAQARRLVLIDEAEGGAARVHDSKELLRAGIARTPILFLSPVFETRSHPKWKPIPLMRAAALLRLARAPVIALGGVNQRKYGRIQRLSFSGWAGIDGWIRI